MVDGEVYSTTFMPNFVKEWFGQRRLHLIKMTAGTWLFCGEERSLIINARKAQEARDKARDFVSFVDQRTDKRRRKWFYT